MGRASAAAVPKSDEHDGSCNDIFIPLHACRFAKSPVGCETSTTCKPRDLAADAAALSTPRAAPETTISGWQRGDELADKLQRRKLATADDGNAGTCRKRRAKIDG